MKHRAIQKIAYIPLMSVIITLCAWITIPFAVPFTMQTFGVFLALKILGGRDGTLSVLIYLLMGAVGLPVFSSFGAGVGYILGPTGGYLAGFLLCAVIYYIFEKVSGKGKSDLLPLITGMLAYYLCGTLWFIFSQRVSGSAVPFAESILLCTLPYIIPDVLKLFLAQITAPKIKRIIRYDKSI